MKLIRLAFTSCTSLALLASLWACTDRKADPAPTVAASAPAAPAPTAAVPDKWLGKWNGPEGTFLELAGGNGRYELTIRNLDGPRTFPAVAAADQVTFERDGVKEQLRATRGAETGMKWLSEKSDCLTVRAGEGYCRD